MLQQQQIGEECLIAALCNMQDIDYQHVRERIQSDFGRTWSQLYKDALTGMDLYGYECLVDEYKTMLRIITTLWPTVPMGLTIDLMVPRLKGYLNPLECPRLNGTGILISLPLDNGNRHAVAFQDDWVVDSRIPDVPMPFLLWAVTTKVLAVSIYRNGA